MSKLNGISSKSHPEYKIYNLYNNMKNRCYYKKMKQFIDYGMRGITVCDEWLNDFMSFYSWCKENGWKEGLQIDRINNNGNYEPINCQFVKPSENTAIGKRRKRNDNCSGYTGIALYKRTGKYQAQIMVNNKLLHLGYFNTKDEAVQSRIDAEILYLGKQLTNL